jgi:transketolase
MHHYSSEQLEVFANNIRENIIEMLLEAKSGHTAGPLDLADIYTALFFEILKHDPKNPNWEERDLLVVSNGHTIPVCYATMAEAGYFPKKELLTLRKLGSRLQGHPERLRLPGLETTSGPLGSGLSQAAGMALALRLNNQLNRRVYVIMGDGEIDEGNVWEAAMFCAKNKLDNLIAIIDRNNIQIDGFTEDVMPLDSIKARFEAFNWYVLEVDGNNIESVIDTIIMAQAIEFKPVLILAHTIAGKGVDFMENNYSWHGKPPNSEEAKKALHELRTLGGRIRSEHQ